ncbi:hypothetical protein [Xanthomonas sp. 3498]|uniref:hypothetical protein n=1 Tax=Xanthomonas sp. 3498 TaxID=2663863 RepID=UPI00180E504E|nr:hypothetical protein [Xanthomonas sp. 3498]MBB5876150.1 hypothetical protein [Xanthomonas sp. 3498]
MQSLKDIPQAHPDLGKSGGHRTAAILLRGKIGAVVIFMRLVSCVTFPVTGAIVETSRFRVGADQRATRCR